MIDAEGLHRAVSEAHDVLSGLVPFKVRTGLVLGSGLGLVRRAFEILREIPYRDIPHFPVSTVQGHRGRLIVGKHRRHRLLIMDGRIHLYEGHSLAKITFPMHLMRAMGVSTMIITNAAGAISRRVVPGDLMLIEDHIDLMWRGVPGLSSGPQVVHKPYYSRALIDLAYSTGIAQGLPVKRGVLMATTGPSYETRSEVEFSRKIAADAATMSTVPEVTACHSLGIAVLGVSLITNVAATHEGGHEKVVEVARRSSKHLRKLILGVIDRI